MPPRVFIYGAGGSKKNRIWPIAKPDDLCSWWGDAKRLILTDVEFYVDQERWQQYKAEHKSNIHAGVMGVVTAIDYSATLPRLGDLRDKALAWTPDHDNQAGEICRWGVPIFYDLPHGKFRIRKLHGEEHPTIERAQMVFMEAQFATIYAVPY